MIRRLPSLPTILSLLVCVAVAAVWARSHTRCDRVGFAAARARPGKRPAGYTVLLSAYRGGLYLLWLESERDEPGLMWGFGSDVIDRPYVYDPDPGQGLLGFRYAPRRAAVLNAEGFVGLPLWFVLALAAAPAAFARARAARRRRLGLCPCCGYDLRATPGRCPECGWGTAAVG
jgi:hypothetical protein